MVIILIRIPNNIYIFSHQTGAESNMAELPVMLVYKLKPHPACALYMCVNMHLFFL